MKTLLTTLFLLLCTCMAWAQFNGKVIAIADGDTFTVLTTDKRQIKIRLHGIDCPEKKQPYGTRAKQYLSDMIFGKVVTVNATDTDRYGRTIAIAMYKGKDVGMQMLYAGMAWHYVRYDKSKAYAAAAALARKERRGLWADNNPVAPWDWRRKK